MSMRSEPEQKFVILVSDKDFFPSQVANMLDLSKVRSNDSSFTAFSR